MEPRKRKTFQLRLSRFELVHLRDLLSVMLPPDLKQTVSQALAVTEDRSMVEAHLWNVIAKACLEADVPVGDDAPNFVAAASSAPTIGVFKLADDPEQFEEPKEERVNPFGEGDDDEKACGNCGTAHKTEKQRKRCFGSTEESE